MAHELSQIEINGQRIVEAMYANTPAWHGLGTIFDANGNTAPTSEEAIKLAHLDWEVATEPLQLKQDGKEVADHFAVVRQDLRTVLGVVGPDYKVLQNRESFAFLDSLQQDGVMRFESAFALKGGREIALVARMPSVDFVTPQDVLLRYIFWTMAHDGTGAIIGMPTSVRVVCANTKRLAISLGERSKQMISIVHRGDLNQKLDFARKYLSQWDEKFTLFTEGAKGLLKGYTQEQAEEYIATLFPAPEQDATKRIIRGHQRKVDQVKSFRRSESNNLQSIKGTWWSLYNTVSQFVDHGKPGRQSKDPTVRAENRFARVTGGDGAALKDEAFELAVQLSA